MLQKYRDKCFQESYHVSTQWKLSPSLPLMIERQVHHMWIFVLNHIPPVLRAGIQCQRSRFYASSNVIKPKIPSGGAWFGTIGLQEPLPSPLANQSLTTIVM
jgi:hypothetical protein